MNARGLVYGLAIIFFAAAFPGAAQAAGAEHISDFTTAGQLDQSGKLQLEEAITYDFGPNSRHGIYRDIPLIYHDDQGHEYRPAVAYNGADMDGRAVPVEQDRSNGVLRLKIGDPDRTVTGTHLYHIHYSLSPFVLRGAGAGLFKLNITGTGWTIPIDHAGATLTLPAAVSAPLCRTGAVGSQEQNCRVELTSGRVLTASTTAGLAPAQGLSLFANLPTGAVATYLTPYTPPRATPLQLALDGLAALAVLGVTAWLIWRRVQEWRARHDRTVIAQYEAPDNLRPAELGLLADNRSGMPEITATLIDLAVRGHLKIRLVRAKSWLAKAEYEFTRLNGSGSLEPYEQQLLDALFTGADTQLLSKVDRIRLPQAIIDIKAQLGERLRTRGYYVVTPGSWRRVLPAFLLALAAAGVLFGLVPLAGYGFLAGAFVCTWLAWLLVRRPTGMTAAGTEEWAKVAGFRLYLSVAEKDRLNFTDAPARTPELFNQLLPAAVALQVERQWAAQFDGLDVAAGTNWYDNGSGTWTALALTSALSDDFGPAIASGFAPVSSGSGGVSGGGFWGGGGGSW